MYQIIFAKPATRNIKKLDKRYSKAFEKALLKLSTNPQSGERLAGKLRGYWKLKFSRYRIVYQIKKQLLIVIILDVDHRKNIYR